MVLEVIDEEIPPRRFFPLYFSWFSLFPFHLVLVWMQSILTPRQLTCWEERLSEETAREKYLDGELVLHAQLGLAQSQVLPCAVFSSSILYRDLQWSESL